MSEVKRYDMSGYGDGMIEVPDGAFAYLEDHQSELAALREENERLKSESFEELYNAAIDELDAQDELRALLAAPAVERQPVDAILLENCEEVTVQDHGRGYFATDDCVTQLYTSPPAPVAVVLPSKQEISSLVWNEVLKAEAIPGVSCFNAAEFAVEAVISLIKELNP